ncbi:MAG: hypothetical protein ACRDPT_11825 [Streptomycetales bacterium]
MVLSPTQAASGQYEQLRKPATMTHQVDRRVRVYLFTYLHEEQVGHLTFWLHPAGRLSLR